jgi:protein-disulfide isomerase
MSMTKKLYLPILLSGLVFLTGCMSDEQFKDKLAQSLKENPEIILDWIKANPALFIQTMQEAVVDAQQDMRRQQEEMERQQFLASMDNPLDPMIRPDEAIRGPKDAPITLIEYSDFQCPYCTRGFQTVMNLMDRYKGKIRFIYKHLPLSFHDQAEIAARYFEAIRLQSPEKAFQFHDLIFEDQRKLAPGGENFLKELARKVNADMTRLAQDIRSDVVSQRIAEDMAEAERFGIQGTPGFVINGVPVKGAYPPDHFVEIIQELQNRGRLKL